LKIHIYSFACAVKFQTLLKLKIPIDVNTKNLYIIQLLLVFLLFRLLKTWLGEKLSTIAKWNKCWRKKWEKLFFASTVVSVEISFLNVLTKFYFNSFFFNSALTWTMITFFKYKQIFWIKKNSLPKWKARNIAFDFWISYKAHIKNRAKICDVTCTDQISCTI
jgi:hypothetical protein